MRCHTAFKVIVFAVIAAVDQIGIAAEAIHEELILRVWQSIEEPLDGVAG